MDIPVPYVVAQLAQVHGNLLLRLAQRLLEQPHHHALEVVEQVLLLPAAEQPQARVLGPRPARQLEDLLDDVLEAGVLKLRPPPHRVVDGRAVLAARVLQHRGEALEGAVVGDGAVVAVQNAGDAVELCPASGLEMPEDGGEFWSVFTPAKDVCVCVCAGCELVALLD